MTIQELEQRTNLERATIRYYEREGLIHPARKENSYRDYSEEDVEEILKIKLLRQLELPIDQIRKLQQGSAVITDVLRQQASTLDMQAQAMKRAADICREISNQPTTYSTFNPTVYLEKMQETHAGETAVHNKTQYDYKSGIHPVRRFVARVADYTLLYAIIRFVIIVVLRVRPYGDLLSIIISYGVPILAVPILAWLEHRFATTPGKWMMGIRIESISGEHMTMSQALSREWDALIYGYGFGIPIIRLWRLYRSYNDYTNDHPMEQDAQTEHIFEYWIIHWNVAKKSIFAGFCCLIVTLNILNVLDYAKPVYRTSKLTVAQFAKNYNFYSELLLEDSGRHLESDGSFRKYKNDTGNNGIYLGGSTAAAEYQYSLEGERLVGISYTNTYKDFMFLQPIPDHILNACITAVMSQPGMGHSDVINITTLLLDSLQSSSANIQYENITIQWCLTAINCQFLGSYYLPSNNNKDYSLTLQFEIAIQ